MSTVVSLEALKDSPVNFFEEADWARLGQPESAEAFLLATADAIDFYGTPARRYQHPLYARVREMARAIDSARLRISGFVVDACLPDETDLDIKDDLRSEVDNFVVAGLIWGSLFAKCATLEDRSTMESTNNQHVGERS